MSTFEHSDTQSKGAARASLLQALDLRRPENL
jgi:hypothetical protein